MQSSSNSDVEEEDLSSLEPKLFGAKVKKKQLNLNLKAVCKLLGETSQDASESRKDAITPMLNVLCTLLKERYAEVDKYTLSICFIDCLRVFAPHAPFQQQYLGDIFRCILECLETQLKQSADSSSVRLFTLVEKLSTIKALVLLIDIEDENPEEPLLFRPFDIIFNSITVSHYDSRIAELVADILINIIEEMPSCPDVIIELMLKKVTSKSPAPAQLARHIFARCAQHLQGPVSTYLSQILRFSEPGEEEEDDEEVGDGFSELQPLIRQLFLANPASPDILLHVMPMLQNELTRPDTKSRMAAVNLLCEMFEHADSMMHEEAPQLFSALLRRFGDKEVAIRERMLGLSKDFVVAHPLAHVQLVELLGKTCSRLMDPADSVRTLACNALTRIACDTDHVVSRAQLEDVARRILDKKGKVRAAALGGLARVYHTLVVAGDTASDEEHLLKSWIPCAIMKCYLSSSEPAVRVAIESAINNEVIGDDTVERTHRLIKLLFNISEDRRAFDSLKRMLMTKQQFQQHFATALRLGSLKRRDEDDEAIYSNALKHLGVQLPGSSVKNEELLRKCCATGSKQEYKKAWQIVCNAGSSRKKVTEAQKHLLSRLRKSIKPEFVSALLLKLCMSIVFPDNVPELLVSVDEYIASKDEASVAPLISLLELLATLFPSFFADEKVFAAMHLVIKERPNDPLVMSMLLNSCPPLQQVAPRVAKSLKATLVNMVKDVDSSHRLASLAIHAIAAIYPTPIKAKLMGAIVASVSKKTDAHSLNVLSNVLKCYPDAVQKPQRYVKNILKAGSLSSEGSVFLARFLLSVGSEHPKFDQLTRPIFSRFTKLLSDPSSDSALRCSIIESCVLLESLLPFTLFNTVACCAFDADEDVRRAALASAQASKSLRALAMLSLFDLDPVSDIRKTARSLLDRLVTIRRSTFEATHHSNILPEHATPHLVHILAHWDQFNSDVEDGCPRLHSYLKAFLDSVLRGSSPNFSFLSTYFEELKLCKDADTENDRTTELATVCDLGSRYIIQESERRKWTQHSQPSELCVPASLFQVASEPLESLLPATFQTPKRPMSSSPTKRKSAGKKSTGRRKKKKQALESEEEEEEEEEMDLQEDDEEEEEEEDNVVLDPENSASSQEASRKSKRSPASVKEATRSSRPKRTRRKK